MPTHSDPLPPRHSPAALRDRRRDAGLSQRAVAQRAGISQSFLSQLETGERSPSLRVMLALAEALGRPVTDLIPQQRKAS